MSVGIAVVTRYDERIDDWRDACRSVRHSVVSSVCTSGSRVTTTQVNRAVPTGCSVRVSVRRRFIHLQSGGGIRTRSPSLSHVLIRFGSDCRPARTARRPVAPRPSSAQARGRECPARTRDPPGQRLRRYQRSGGRGPHLSSEAEPPPFTAGRKPTRCCATAGIGRAGFPTDA